MINFWDLTPEQIRHGMELIVGREDVGKDDPLHDFVQYPALHSLAKLWADCDGDMTLMRIRYNDEIEQIMRPPLIRIIKTRVSPGIRSLGGWTMEMPSPTVIDLEDD